MRYTTIIDISQSEIYKNVNARLVYLHLCLRAGYHDEDRDLVVVSIRNLAIQVGLSLSATRFAVGQLEKLHLLTHTGSVWRVKKWVDEQIITSRKKAAQQAKQAAAGHAAEEARRAEAEKQAEESARREEIRNSGKTPFEQYYEAMIIKAQQGDIHAAEVVEKRKAMYESIIKNKKL